MQNNILIIGAGGVSHVAAHKCAQNNDVFGNICIASRTQSKCDLIIESIKRKQSLKIKEKNIYSKQINAFDIDATIRLIKDTNSSIVINVCQSFANMSILEACIRTGASYIDTAIHEDPDKICESPIWYENHEWKRRDKCTENKITAILSVGFDPGIVNAYCSLAQKKYFDTIDTIEIMDVNAGNHGQYFATNFDPEINFREFTGNVWVWENNKWESHKIHSVKQIYKFPEVGEQTIYLSGHDEIHSLVKNIKAKNIRFWMGFSDHYINVFSVLKNIGLLSEKSIKTAEGVDIVPLKVVKACLPDPKSLAPNYEGKTCIGCLIKGKKNNKSTEIFIYNICDHKNCYNEVESQAISYTAGVPAAAAAILIANETWKTQTMTNVEELDPEPFINLLDRIGLRTKIDIH
jgi:saccharopine dehydrogenase-like NADP-dependent oxidoreductase